MCVLEGSFAGLQGLAIPCQSAYTCKSWDYSLKVLNGRLSSQIPDSPSPSFGWSKIVQCSVLIYLIRRAKNVRRGPDARLDGSRGVQTDKEANLGLDKVDDKKKQSNSSPLSYL